MAESNPEKKKRIERLKLALPVKYLNLNSSKEGQAMMCNISDGGIGFFTNEELPADTPLDIWIQMPDGGYVYVKGKVAWSKKLDADNYRAGIRLGKEEVKAMQLAVRAIQGLTGYYP